MNANAQTKINPRLNWFAVFTAFVTFLLIGLGGLVTSNGAGMSVPDWPNSYGYNMFLFPIKDWVGGIFYEHTHRLLASAVGLLTTILAIWIWRKDSRNWMKWLGVAAFLGVVAQGILGGLRVTLINAHLGIFHAIVGQLFFVLMCAIALFTSRFWNNLQTGRAGSPLPADGAHGVTHPTVSRGLQNLVVAATILIFFQLILGATMRQAHAGLSIPDFPLAYGKIWPDTSAAAVAHDNAQRISALNENPITAFQIILQMIHRIVALAIFILVAICTVKTWRQSGKRDPLTKLSMFWLALIVCQIALGIETIWSDKAADIATLHVMVGALSLVTGALLCIISFGCSASATETKTVSFGAFGTLAVNK